MTDLEQRRRYVATWIEAERAGHADSKWGTGQNRRTALTHMEQDPAGHWYLDYVRQYMHRAGLVGLDSPAGRQLLGKATVTLLHALETAVEVYGELPAPGRSSGDVEPWDGSPALAADLELPPEAIRNWHDKDAD